MLSGLFLCILAIYTMLGFNSIITTDQQFLGCLFAGIGLCCVGFLIESLIIVPVNRYQREQKKKGIVSMIISISLCTVMLVMIKLYV
jgi:hypothetical protein